jgi:hypothetical protein
MDMRTIPIRAAAISRCGKGLPAGVLALANLLPVAQVRGQSPFAAQVVGYRPAPGQFVNDPDFSDPIRALGPPAGGGTVDPSHESVVTLGGFGGYIVLRFDHVVEDHPLNPFGMDAIVFGNAHWIANNPNRHWAECATIEIALDENGDGRIDGDELWYLIPGSHVSDPFLQLASQTWDDDPQSATPPSMIDWVPAGKSGAWTTSGHALPSEIFGAVVIENPTPEGGNEGVFGYADYSPTLVLGDLNGDNVVDDPTIGAADFYTRPDDPRAVGISPGSGGGDAFDIVWAVHPVTGESAGLGGFNFIRMTTAVDAVLGFLGEKSAEIDAVSDASPDAFGDLDDDGDLDLFDVRHLQVCFGFKVFPVDACFFLDEHGDGTVDEFDAARILTRFTGPGR